MTSQTDQQALNQARAQGEDNAIRQLRRFTGIPGYVPVLTEPEHRAYFAYEQDLIHGLAIWRDHLNHRQSAVKLLIDQRDEARRSMDAEQRRREEARENSNTGSKLVGKLLDVSFPEKRRHAALSKDVDTAWESKYEADARVLEIHNELAEVSNWLDQMLTDIDSARATR
jgi:hypothetical protein